MSSLNDINRLRVTHRVGLPSLEGNLDVRKSWEGELEIDQGVCVDHLHVHSYEDNRACMLCPPYRAKASYREEFGAHTYKSQEYH